MNATAQFSAPRALDVCPRPSSYVDVLNLQPTRSIPPIVAMDTTSKAAPLASPKVVKNSKGALVPSSQMAHIAYGCGKRPASSQNAHS